MSYQPIIYNQTASGNITTQNLVPAGTATTNSAVEITLNGATTITVQTTGTYTGALSLQVTVNGTTWVTLAGIPFLNLNTGGYLATITSALQSIFQADVAGAVRARVTALAAVTGTATININVVQSAAMVALDAALPTGTNSIGNIATVTTVTTCSTLTTLANGQTAHSSAATGSPVRVAGRVVETTIATQDQTLVAGDAANLPVTTSNQVINKPFATAEIDWVYAPPGNGISNTTTAVTFKAASGTAGIRTYVTGLQVTWNTLGATTELAIRDGAGGTVLWRTMLGTAAGTVIVPLLTPLKSTANTLMEIVTLTAVTGNVYVNVQGYTGV